MRWPALVHALSVRYKLARRLHELERHVEACRNRPMCDWGFKLFSQNGEDGYIAALVDRIGLGSGKFVEFGFAPEQNNLLAFALRYHASGLFLDASSRNCRIASRMLRYLGRGDITVKQAWIDKDNIDKLIAEGIGAGEIDILSIDVDGNDYWLWQNIVTINPRIVIAEYNAGFGPDRAVTVPYDPKFDRTTKLPTTAPNYAYVPRIYFGASLAAFAKLGTQKGYSLVCCETRGVNAFFVRNDLLGGDLVANSPHNCFYPHRQLQRWGVTQEMQETTLYSQPIVEV